MSARLGTLPRYISRRFFNAVISVYAACAVLIFLIDFVELLRRAGSKQDIGAGVLMLMALYRMPAFTEQALPFAVLLGSMTAFLGLSRRNELVIARAAGMSVWQFMLPAVAVALLIGLIAVSVFNPLSAFLREEELRLETDYFGNTDSSIVRSQSSGAWLRQESVDGQSVIHAKRSRLQGLVLDDVTVFAFDRQGAFVERVHARTAKLVDDNWKLDKAWIMSTNAEPQFYETYLVSTYLTQTQIQESFGEPENISFWALPSFIDHAERAGLSATPYRLQFHLLLSRPFLLAAMVVIAATVSLRLFRFGNIGRLVAGGVAAGFAFFLMTQMMGDLGAYGLLAPAAAAWIPVIVVVLAGLTILLYQEDG